MLNENENEKKNKNDESVFAISCGYPFVVAPEKAAEFIERSKKEAGKSKEALLKRLAEHDKGDVLWENESKPNDDSFGIVLNNKRKGI